MKSISLLIATLAVSVTVVSCAHAQPTPTVLRGPIVGAVTDTTARVTVQWPTEAKIAIEASATKEFTTGVIRTASDNASAAGHDFVTLSLTGLSPSTRYYLRPVVNDTVRTFPMERSFTTFPTMGKDSQFTFCFGSCATMGSYKHSGVWGLMQKLDPLLFIEIGDWSYPDQQVAAQFVLSDSLQNLAYENKYTPTHPIDTLLSKRAVDYVYDDHDFAGGNSDGTNPGASKSIANYDSHFPHYDLPNKEDGIFHTFKAGNVQFFVLDLRSARSPSNEAVVTSNGTYSFAPPAGHSMLRGVHRGGVDQLTWLEQELRASTSRWKVILSSVTWNPAMKNFVQLGVAYANFKHDPSKLYAAVDSWVGYPEDQDSLLAFIAREKINNILFCSGDVHTGMMDDGEHSVFPEIVAANLEVKNSNLYGQFDSLGLAPQLWDKGGQARDTANCYGRISVVTHPYNMLNVELVNERDSVVARYLMPDATSPLSVRGMGQQMSNGVKILNQSTGSMSVQINIEHEGPTKFYLADAAGKNVRTFADGSLQPGIIRYRLTTTDYPSGTYFFILEAEGRMWKQQFSIVH
jgi:phosphodiesterase/alkaline phosphatase D-like protein